MEIKIDKCQKCGCEATLDKTVINFFGYTIRETIECTDKDCGYVTLVADKR